MTAAALLFTDVVDSTKLVEELGDARAARFWADHDRHARRLLALHGGREIDRTDGFFIVFDVAALGVRFATDYHRALGEQGRKARIGLHVGPVTLRANTPEDIARGAKPVEVEGLAKPLAARIMTLASPGQTLLSATARAALADDDLPPDCATLSHGYYQLKGIEQPLEVFELAARDSAFVPPQDSEKAYRVVRAGDLWRTLREVPHNLPTERDAFVGRGAELRALARRLSDGARLVTVLGLAGIGKTRLACRYGLTMLGEWTGGVYFCDLSDARSADGVHFAVAFALGVPLGSGDPATQLGHAIAARGRCLLVLDNFEQVVSHAAATLQRWFERARDAAFVVTSRERLRLPGEEVLPIEPLPLADDAVALFVARARAQRPDFALGGANRAAVDEVVRLLDGLPLAIELAAARVRLFSPAQLVQRMTDRFGLLTGARGAKRQSALKVALDWSWDLLTPVEQSALAQCAVFEGGFTLAAAEAVLALEAGSDTPLVADVVQSLVDKSLLRSRVAVEPGRVDVDEPRFGMYFSIHEYADAKLGGDETPQRTAAQQRHGRYYARLGTEEELDAVSMHGGKPRLAAMMLELDHLVSACRRAMKRSDFECAVATYRACCEVLELRGPYRVAIELGSELLLAREALPPLLRAVATFTWAQAAWRAGRTDEAQATMEGALDVAREFGAVRLQARCHAALGSIERERGRTRSARARFESALPLVRALGNRLAEGRVLANLALVDPHHQGGATAIRHFEAALVAHREVGNRRDEGIATCNLGILRANFGHLEEALQLLGQALAIHREVDDRRSEGNALANIGLVLHELGRDAEALPYQEQALEVIRRVGARGIEGFIRHALGNLHRGLGLHAKARADLDAAIAIYSELDMRGAAGEALGHLGELHADERRYDDARAAFEQGELRLREVGDPITLCVLLCARGEMDVALGDPDHARRRLDEAEALAMKAGGGTESLAWRAVKELRAVLA